MKSKSKDKEITRMGALVSECSNCGTRVVVPHSWLHKRVFVLLKSDWDARVRQQEKNGMTGKLPK